jgi:threonyl-tRNA synthetase
MPKVLDLLENHEIRALIDNKKRLVRKLEMLKCKIPFMLIVGEEEKKRNHFYPSPWTEGKGNVTVTIEEFLL